MASHGITLVIEPGDLRIREKETFLFTAARKPLSTAVYGSLFPKEPAGEFLHYTKVPVLENVASTGQLRLYTIRKRMEFPEEGEFLTYARLQGWEGYLNEPADLKPASERIGNDLFYMSLTRTDAKNESELWSEFGDGGMGMRLRLRVDTAGRAGDLRAIRYRRTGEKDVLRIVNETLAAEGLPPIAPEGTYRAGAFALPAYLGHETEVRLLYMHPRGQPDRHENDGSWDYCPISIVEPNDIADVRLVAVEIGPQVDMSKIREVLKGTRFADVPLRRA